MKESKFNTEIVNSLKEQGAWAEKIPDTPLSFGMRFNPEKPCDIVGGYRLVFFAIESKQMKKFEALGIRHFRSNQIEALDDAVKTGNPAFVFLNVRISTPRTNRMIILPWKIWGDRIKRESIMAKEIKELPYVQGAKDRFPMQEFFRMLERAKEEGW